MASTAIRLFSSALLALVLCGCASQRPSASAVASSKEAAARSSAAIPPVSYSLEIVAPPEARSSSSIPWVEIRGRAGRAELFEADLVIALDLSQSALFPSGLDLDDDGVIGRLRGSVLRSTGSGPAARSGGELDGLSPAIMRSGNAWSMHPRNWTTDRDDTIAEMQFGAARSLVHGLGPRRNRIGLVTYTQKARVRAELGEPEAAFEALEDIRVTGASTSTNVAAALRKARHMLTGAEGAEGRQKAVLLFTDGRPTFPADEYLARVQALYAADNLAQGDIDLYVFTLGMIGMHEARFLLELAGAAEGRLYRVGDPRRLLEDLPPVDLAPRWLEIENATTGALGEAIRSEPDGRFDAFVPLEPGENKIRVLAELGDGKLQRWEHEVLYEPPEAESEEQRSERERVLEELRSRSAEAASEAAPVAE